MECTELLGGLLFKVWQSHLMGTVYLDKDEELFGILVYYAKRYVTNILVLAC